MNVSLQDFCRYDGTPNHLHGDNANELMKGDALATCREKCIKVTATEADHPNQNHAAEYMIGVIKQMTMRILEHSGAPANLWDYAAKYASHIWNHTSNIRLHNLCPLELKEGSTPDISVFRFEFYQRVKFRRSKMHFPSSSGMQTGRFLGIAWNAGDTFTYYVLDDESRRVLTRGVVVAVDNTAEKQYLNNVVYPKFFYDEEQTKEVPVPTKNDVFPSFMGDPAPVTDPASSKRSSLANSENVEIASPNTSHGCNGSIKGTMCDRETSAEPVVCCTYHHRPVPT